MTGVQTCALPIYPWGLNSSDRNGWIKEMSFPVRVFGAAGEDRLPDDVEWLFWVGCAGAFEDKAKKTTKAVAELLHLAGVEFMVLGDGETCTGDSARRAGNEFLYQMQAQANIEVLNEIGAKKIITTCPASKSLMALPVPLYGTCTMLSPAADANNAADRCDAVPTPDDA